TAGAVNGDDYSDIIVGASRFDQDDDIRGLAYVYLGSPAGPHATAAWTTESGQTYAAYGYSVAGAGDVNGDGYSDVIVGAYAFDNGEVDEGRAYLFLGSATGLGASPAW